MMKGISLKKGIEDSYLLYILLFLACLNFMGRGPVVFLIFCIWGLIRAKNGKFQLNVSSACYLLMGITSTIASVLYFDSKDIVKSLVYFLSFAVGYMGYYAARDKQLFIKRTVFWAFVGFLLYLLFTYYMNFVVIGHIDGQRRLYNIWTNEFVAVTLIGLMCCVPIAYSFYCIFCTQNWIYRIVGVVCVVIVFMINMGTATRTPIVMTVVVYAFMLCVLFRSKVVKHKARLVTLLSIAAIFIAYKIVPIIESSALAERMDEEGLETSRNDITFKYMDNMLDYPFGGSQIQEHIHYLAHNFVLEAYDMYSVFFFIPMIILFVLMAKRFFKLLRIRNKQPIIFLLLSIYLACSIQIMLEPVIGGFPQLVWFLFLVDGMTIPYLRSLTASEHQYSL